jgi:peptidoglycan/LPS O-acetylase OafA/YrhL
MDVYAIWPFFLCILALLAVAASPLFAAVDRPLPSGGGRVITLDGLRGFLALAVYFHHAAIYHDFLLGRGWHIPSSQFYTMLAQVGVAVFFMITGFLFWTRMIKTSGRPGWIKLYVGRVFRIGPVYILAISIMTMMVFVQAGMQLQVPLFKLAKQLIAWARLGLFPTLDLNGDANAAQFIAYVTWSLHWEWLFYLSLPFTALAARRDWMHLPFAAVGLVTALGYAAWTNKSTTIIAALFFAGMLTASLQQRNLMRNLHNATLSALVIGLVTLAFSLFPTAYAVGPVVLLGLAFYLIASGCTVFGILTTRGARRLGEISYGIYLLQGLVLALMFATVGVRDFALASPLDHWIVGLAGSLLLVLSALLAHVTIERPGIDLGRHLASAAVEVCVRARTLIFARDQLSRIPRALSHHLRGRLSMIQVRKGTN